MDRKELIDRIGVWLQTSTEFLNKDVKYYWGTALLDNASSLQVIQELKDKPTGKLLQEAIDMANQRDILLIPQIKENLESVAKALNGYGNI